jgi:DNA-binding protein HU-beta
MARTATKTTRPAAASKAPKTTETLTLRQIASDLADSHGLSKRQTEELLNDAIARITKGIRKGHRVQVRALGIFSVKKLAARKGRNPATGEPIKIKASKKVAFRAAKDLKDAL